MDTKKDRVMVIDAASVRPEEVIAGLVIERHIMLQHIDKLNKYIDGLEAQLTVTEGKEPTDATD